MSKCANPDCKNDAEYKCPECKILYCVDCAGEGDYECDCISPPKLERIK